MNSICGLLTLFVLLTFVSIAYSQQSPLSKYSKLWGQEVYKKANTADSISYLKETEKEIIYILDLARMNPQLFNETVVKKYNRTMYGCSDYFKKIPIINHWSNTWILFALTIIIPRQ